MKECHPMRIRLVFEPNRFASEQLIKVYEKLQPLKSSVTTEQSKSTVTENKPAAAKGVAL